MEFSHLAGVVVILEFMAGNWERTMGSWEVTIGGKLWSICKSTQGGRRRIKCLL